LSCVREGTIRLYGLTFALVAPEPVWELALARLPPAEETPHDAPARTYRVEPAIDGALTLQRGRARPLAVPDAFAAAYHLVADLERVLAQRAPGLVFVHAGAVAWRGRAIVLPGASGSGKSELVAALLRAGADLLSDEYAILDTAGAARPYPRALVLRRGAQERRSAAALGARVAAAPAPVAVVALLRYRPQEHWHPRGLTRGEAFLALLRHTVAARRRFDLSRAVLLTVAGQASAWQGARGAADEAARELLALAG